jgi:hypothetical protein
MSLRSGSSKRAQATSAAKSPPKAKLPLAAPAPEPIALKLTGAAKPPKAKPPLAAPAPEPIALELTQRNHFKFGYDGIAFNQRTRADQKWWVGYGRCERQPYDLRTECVIAAGDIWQAAKKDLWLCLSGGVDSEIMAHSFLNLQVPIRAAILRLKNDLNLHDISWTIPFCDLHNIKYEIFDLDFEDFVHSGEMLHYADRSKCISPHIPPAMKLIDLIAKKGGYSVLGSAECYLEWFEGRWVMYEREKIASLYRHLLATKTPSQVGFFQWNPEMMLAFLRHPVVRQLVRGYIPGVGNTARIKHQIYSAYWPIVKRPKYTGFELVNRECAEMREVLKERFGMHSAEAKIPLAELFRILLPAKT